MIKSIKFWDRMRAQDFVFDATQDVVISITDPHRSLVSIQSAKEVFSIQFYDVVETVFVSGVQMDPLDETQAQQLHDKVKQWVASKDVMDITIHCEAGASRSAAIALYVFAYTQASFPTICATTYANTQVLALMEHITGLPCIATLADVVAENLI